MGVRTRDPAEKAIASPTKARRSSDGTFGGLPAFRPVGEILDGPPDVHVPIPNPDDDDDLPFKRDYSWIANNEQYVTIPQFSSFQPAQQSHEGLCSVPFC